MSKQKIQNLVEKYEDLKNSGKLKFYTEEEVKKDFILPLFESLGWDVHNKKEVSAEETISSDRVDYGFYLNDRVKFYLEAKKFNVDIHDEKFASQTIKYSFNKGVTWAILTNFETLVVFNAQYIEGKLSDKRFFEINCSEFLSRIDQLNLLSKDAFKNDLLDKDAEKVGKKLQKVSVSNLLYKDLQSCRDILTKDLGLWNNDVDHDLLDEGVQKLLDRLLFIRVAEDRGIEPSTLVPMVRQARGDSKKHLYQSMTEKFREFDSFYNSNLFSKHPFEQWEEYSGATEKVINILYGKSGYYEYDFKAMPADVLGTVYENYLSHRLSKSRKGTTVSKDASKKKEQGIYYTPSYIVDYIVKKALILSLDECKTIEDIKKIKVLDPACGSGSFLIRAFNIIFEKYKEFGFKGQEDLLKIQILKENIYGIDLDQQAVEITRLNLLINALTKREKLPFLDNIKNGNSLISGTDEKLHEYFGKNFRDKKPFNWQEQFPEVFKQSHFNVIIGNPPYGADISKIEQEYFKKLYNIGSTDTAVLFIKKALDELGDGGCLGFIIPKAFCFASNWQKIRDLIWDNVFEIIDCGKVWKEVKLEQVIVILRKGIKQKYYKSGVVEDEQIKIICEIDKSNCKVFGLFLNGVYSSELEIAQKILDNSIVLNDIAKNQRGAMLQKEISNNGDTEVIGGAQLSRAGVIGIKGKINKNLVTDKKAFINQNSILVQRIIAHIENPTDHIKITAIVPKDRKQIIVDTINQITITDKKYHPQFICTLLNSKLLNWYVYRFILGKAIRSMEFDNPTTSRLPIPKIDFYKKSEKEEYHEIVELTDKIIKLDKDLQKSTENSEKWISIKSEIEKVNQKIDDEVYKLYKITDEEIKIIENAARK
ncbi:MAG: N-6 DNA methylase [Minisyncoccales bacterium]